MNAENLTTAVMVTFGLLAILWETVIWPFVVAYKKRKDYLERFGQEMPERGGERND
jgi:hypothetical protein